MNEAALAGQIERLTRSVRLWRLATFILGVVLVCSFATGGTLVTMLMFQLPEQQQLEQVLLHEQHARRQAEKAQQDAEAARRAVEAALQQAQRELEAARRQ
jgi:hypothetical protein